MGKRKINLNVLVGRNIASENIKGVVWRNLQLQLLLFFSIYRLYIREQNHTKKKVNSNSCRTLVK